MRARINILFTGCFVAAFAAAAMAAGQAVTAASSYELSPFTSRVPGSVSYVPGETLHVMATVPEDTMAVSAVMPDGKGLVLTRDANTDIWHNYWTVPAGQAPGGYTALLTATDIEGRTYDSRTSLFYIGDPLPVRVIMSTPEVIYIEKIIEKEISSPKLIKKYAAARISGTRKTKAGERVLQGDIVPLIVSAREHIEKKEYPQAKNELRKVLEIQPDSPEIQRLLSRIETLLKAKNTGKER